MGLYEGTTTHRLFWSFGIKSSHCVESFGGGGGVGIDAIFHIQADEQKETRILCFKM